MQGTEHHRLGSKWGGRPAPRRGAALLVVIFVMLATVGVVVAVLETEMIRMTATRNTIECEQARYLAEAGAAHALAMLEADTTWRAGIPSTEFPAASGNTYSATVVDGPGGNVTLTAVGVTPRATRTLEYTVDVGN
jgi:Tfp pilus assembly protein PilX